MAEEVKTESPMLKVIGSLAALLTLLGGMLYYAGYLFLLGYYEAFNVPVSLLDLSFEQIVAASGTLILPLCFFFLVFYLVFKAQKVSVIADLGKWFTKGVIYVCIILYALVLVFLIRSTGEWFAKREIEGRWSAYHILGQPHPYVSIYTEEPLQIPLKRGKLDKAGTAYVYHNLRLIASTKEQYFFFDENKETMAIKRELVTMIRFFKSKISGTVGADSPEIGDTPQKRENKTKAPESSHREENAPATKKAL